MRHLIIVASAAALLGCAKADKPADTPAAAPAATPAPVPPPPGITLADVAGKWNVVGKNETGDSTLVNYVFTATPDSSHWTMTFPGRPAVPVHVVSVAGDSIEIAAGPYSSVLRKGVQVKTHGSLRMQGGKLVGTTRAHYSVKTADSVRVLKTEGTRAP